MPNPWDVARPYTYRAGDPTEDTIFLAVGHALTKWEGLEAGMASLFTTLVGGASSWRYSPAVRAYGAITSANSRADMVLQAGRAFFHHFENTGTPFAEIEPLEDNLKDIVKHYSGWMSRRNDIAHGYVTEQGGETDKSYQLLPSHSSSRKWPLWTPIMEHPQYLYRAAEIDLFADAFEALDKRATEFALTLDEWRKRQPGAPPP
jgi:hypothetical protein